MSTDAGTCFLDLRKHIIGRITCSAKVDDNGVRTVATVSFQADRGRTLVGPGQ
jgi:hypothetical protein